MPQIACVAAIRTFCGLFAADEPYPVSVRTESEDPRDVTCEDERPVYRVYFWSRGQAPAEVPPEMVGYYCRENRVLDAADVHEVIAWADRTAEPNETYTLYVEHQEAGRTGLIQLAGVDPTIA